MGLIVKLKNELSSRDDSIECQKKLIQDMQQELDNLKDEQGFGMIISLLHDYDQKEIKKGKLENANLKDKTSELNDTYKYQKKLAKIMQQELDDLKYEY